MSIKLICKGALLYSTIFIVLIFISGVDSLMEQGYFIPALSLVVLLCFSCYKLISKEDFSTLVFDKKIHTDEDK